MSDFPDLVLNSPPGGPIMLGLDELREVRFADILHQHFIIGGLTGWGKSEWMRFLIRQLAVRRDTALLLGDGKMDEFPAWKPRASCLALGPSACRQMIEWVQEESVRRYASLVDMKDWLPRSFRIGVDGPHIVAIIDEVHTLFKGKQAGAFIEKFHDVMTMARAAGITLIFSTQRPSAGTIPPDIRDNTTISVGFRTRNHIHTEMLFGDAQVPAHRDLKLPGQCFAQWPGATHPGYERLRGPRDPKETILEVREATKHLRVPLDGLPDVILPDLLQPTRDDDEETAA